jgi:glycosyltransferase involved in cell wall biosynthesis
VRHRFAILLYFLTYSLTDLAILPSEVYAEELARKRIPVKRLLGAIRGVDHRLFNPQVDGRGVRSALGLEDKFVIGWFGLMLPFRQIEEIIIPLIENAGDFVPNAHFLIGGKGQLRKEFIRLQAQKSNLRLTLLGFVPYEELPTYLSSCDVLLCPVSARGRFTQNSSWLKILESLAVGKPIIASTTKLREGDYGELQGIVWTGSDYKSFLESLISVHGNYSHYLELACRQARDFKEYTLEFTIPRIANAIELICVPPKQAV